MRLFSNRVAIVLIPIMALGAALRLWGIAFGLPHIYNADQATFVLRALAFGTGDLNPHYFVIPTLLMYLLFGLYSLYYAFSFLLGTVHSTADFARSYFVDPTPFYLIGRLVSAAGGIGSIALVFLLGRKLYNARVGLVAAAFLSVAFSAVEFSHYVRVEMPQTFLVLVVYLLLYGLWQTGKTRYYLLAGLAAGFTVAFKYPAVALVFPLYLAHFLRCLRDRRPVKEYLLHAGLIGSFVLLLVGFLISTPYAILDYKTFAREISLLSSFSSTRWIGQGESSLLNTWTYLLSHALGLPLAVLSGAGVAYALYRHRPQDALLLAFPVPLVLQFSTQAHPEPHWLNPVLPLFLLGAAALLVEGTARFSRLARRSGLIVALIAGAVVLVSLYRPVKWDYVIAQPDTRAEAKVWVEANIPDGSKILMDRGRFLTGGNAPLQESRENLLAKIAQGEDPTAKDEAILPSLKTYYQWQLAALSGPTYDIVPLLHDTFGGQTAFIQRPPPKDLDIYRQEGVQYVITSSAYYGRYLAEARLPNPAPAASAYLRFYQAVEKDGILLKEFTPKWPNFIQQFGPSGITGYTIRVYRLPPGAP